MSSTPALTAGASPPAASRSRRRPLRTFAIVFAVLVVAGGAVNLASLAFRQSQTRSFTYPAVARLDVDVDSGAVDVVAGSGGGDGTKIDGAKIDGAKITVRRTLTWSFGKPSTEQRVIGDRLVLRSDCGAAVTLGMGCSGRYRVTVPAGTAVVAHSAAGGVTVTGTRGEIQASSSAGAVRVHDVTGRLTLSSSAGGLSGTGLGSTHVEARSSAGGVELSFDHPPSSVEARSSAGGVRVHLSRTPETYRVDADSSAGSTTVDVATDPASPRSVVARSSAGAVHVDYRR